MGLAVMLYNTVIEVVCYCGSSSWTYNGTYMRLRSSGSRTLWGWCTLWQGDPRGSDTRLSMVTAAGETQRGRKVRPSGPLSFFSFHFPLDDKCLLQRESAKTKWSKGSKCAKGSSHQLVNFPSSVSRFPSPRGLVCRVACQAQER